VKPGYLSSSFGFAGSCVGVIYLIAKEPVPDLWTAILRAVACCSLAYLGGKYPFARVEMMAASRSTPEDGCKTGVVD